MLYEQLTKSVEFINSELAVELPVGAQITKVWATLVNNKYLLKFIVGQTTKRELRRFILIPEQAKIQSPEKMQLKPYFYVDNITGVLFCEWLPLPSPFGYEIVPASTELRETSPTKLEEHKEAMYAEIEKLKKEMGEKEKKPTKGGKA